VPENDPPKGAPRDPGDQPYVPYGSAGGGGAGGNFVFTDLAHLDAIIARWTSVRDRIEPHSQKLYEAARVVYPPAEDSASVGQAEALVRSVTAAQEHNDSVLLYVKGYVERLVAARADYVATEEANTDQYRAMDEDGDQ
jgi:hypothetical protein